MDRIAGQEDRVEQIRGYLHRRVALDASRFSVNELEEFTRAQNEPAIVILARILSSLPPNLSKALKRFNPTRGERLPLARVRIEKLHS